MWQSRVHALRPLSSCLTTCLTTFPMMLMWYALPEQSKGLSTSTATRLSALTCLWLKAPERSRYAGERSGSAPYPCMEDWGASGYGLTRICSVAVMRLFCWRACAALLPTRRMSTGARRRRPNTHRRALEKPMVTSNSVVGLESVPIVSACRLPASAVPTSSQPSIRQSCLDEANDCRRISKGA